MPSTLRALQWNKQESALKLVSIPMEQLADVGGEHAVVVKVAFAGICGTDLHVLDGHFPTPDRLILGHEFTGIVASVGPSVRRVSVGNKVVVNPNEGCHRCGDCFCGRVHFCPHGSLSTNIGLARNGGMAEHCVVPDTVVHVLPDDAALSAYVLVEPFSCVCRGYDNLRKDSLTCQSRILIVGMGIAGLLWAQLLHHFGYRQLFASEPLEGRRRIAQRSALFVDVFEPSQVQGMYDVVVECSGSCAAVEQAFTLLRRGGQLCIYGLSGSEDTMKVSPHKILMNELSIVSCFLNPLTFPKTIDLVTALQQDSKLCYKRLGIEEFGLEDHAEAFQKLREGSISKAVFVL